MTVAQKKRKDVARSYRFDEETVAIIGRLRTELRDPHTGQPRSATDVLRQAVRVLARKHFGADVYGKEK